MDEYDVNKKINLVSMTDDEFLEFIVKEERDYANEWVKSGVWQEEESLSRSKREFKELLPGGKDTEGHGFFSIRENLKGKKVGSLWVQWDNPEWHSSYIWDIIIFEGFRRKRYASLALSELEESVKGRGIDSIMLHVFGHNKAAISLYGKMGYFVTNLVMKKVL